MLSKGDRVAGIRGSSMAYRCGTIVYVELVEGDGEFMVDVLLDGETHIRRGYYAWRFEKIRDDPLEREVRDYVRRELS